MLVRKRKRNVYTTMSKHRLHRYPNLAKDFMPLKAHELWVADITYISLKHRFAYLFLITDAYSRKIVGFHVSDLVFGHSHIPWDTTATTGLRLLNPGSPTDRRRQPFCTYMTALVDDGVLSDVTLHRLERPDA